MKKTILILQILVICVLLSLFNYFLDAVWAFQDTISNPEYLGAYFIFFLFQMWAIIPLMLLFSLLNKTWRAFHYRGIQIAYIIACSFLLKKYILLEFEMSFYFGEYRDVKILLSYIIAGITYVIIDKPLFFKLRGQTDANTIDGP